MSEGITQRWLRDLANRYIVWPVFEKITKETDKLMATIQEFESAFAKYKADVSAKLGGLSSQVAALQKKLDDGVAIEAADLDKLKGEVEAADAELGAPAVPITSEPEPPPPGGGEVSGPGV